MSRARVHWIDRPSGPRPRVCFANHSSHLDFVVLWAALPAPIRILTRPVAAEEYCRSTALGSYVATRIFRSLLVPRMDVAALARRGEGTRGDGAEVARFKSGLYQLCHPQPHVEAVPVYLENLHRVLPKGQVVPLPLGSSVTFGRPLLLGGGEGNREFLARARQALVELRDR